MCRIWGFQTSPDTRSGLSLLEMLIVIAISVGVILVLVRFVGVVATIDKFLSQKLQPQQDLAQALQGVVTEIRSMGPSSIGGYPIDSASATSVIFYSDVDEDGLFDRVRYTIQTSTLQRGIVKPTGNPLQYVTSSESVTTPIVNLIAASSSFFYFDDTYTGTQAPFSPTSTVTTIRVLQLTMTGDVSTSSAPKPLMLTNTVMIRNLKSN